MTRRTPETSEVVTRLLMTEEMAERQVSEIEVAFLLRLAMIAGIELRLSEIRFNSSLLLNNELALPSLSCKEQR